MAPITSLLVALFFTTWLQVAAEASDQQIVYIRNTCECWSNDLKCVCKIESDPTSVRPLMQRLVNRTAEYYWQEIEFQSMVYDRTTFILANTFADGPFPSGITFKGDFSIVNDSFNHLNMTLNRVELNFETFSGRKPKFSKQYWRYIFDHGEATLRSLKIIKYQIEDFIIPNYLGAALTQEVRPLTEFKVVGCEVKEVKERAFKNFTQLEVLDLSDNHLTTLPENVFSRNINLQKILLANNQISFLTKTIFDGLPNLLLINLRKNKLTAVPAIPRHTNRRFQPMVYLMADNSIHCRCSLIWVLHELTFHHNLEIEATCSDPTMVRGMPIIEGFTRMDKEACYRVLNARKEDGIESDKSSAEVPQIGSESKVVEPPVARSPSEVAPSSNVVVAPQSVDAPAVVQQASAQPVALEPQQQLPQAANFAPKCGILGCNKPRAAEPLIGRSTPEVAPSSNVVVAPQSVDAPAVVQQASAQPVALEHQQQSLQVADIAPRCGILGCNKPRAVESPVVAAAPAVVECKAAAEQTASAPQSPVAAQSSSLSPGYVQAAVPPVAAAAPASVNQQSGARESLITNSAAAAEGLSSSSQKQSGQLVNVAPQTVLAPAQFSVPTSVVAAAPADERDKARQDKTV